ncbi:MAG: hypothetical protein KDB79_15565 [Acidobacteria bacterium]|nr:hypothetical protein [Acidobacteriota bacterium]
MMKIAKHIAYAVVLFFAFIAIAPVNVPAQYRLQDKEIRYKVQFARGKTGTVVKKQIRLGTTHIYSVRAQKGQRMAVTLTTGKQTSFTIYSPTEGIIEGADGGKMWRGTLNETGEYLIAIGTDKTAKYGLEIFIK